LSLTTCSVGGFPNPTCDTLNFDANGYGLFCDAVTLTCAFYGRKTSGMTCSVGAECTAGLACDGTVCLPDGQVNCSTQAGQNPGVVCNSMFGKSPINGFCNCQTNINVPGTCAEMPAPSINDCLLPLQAYQQCLYSQCSIGGISEFPKAGSYPYDADGCARTSCQTQANVYLCCLNTRVSPFNGPPGFALSSCTAIQSPRASPRTSGPRTSPRRSASTTHFIANAVVLLIIAAYILL